MADCVIFNPEAGSADALSAFRGRLEEIGFDFCAANSAEHSRELARNAVQRGANRVIAAGGDGTVNTIAAALLDNEADHKPALGVLPLGTGNDFRRTLGMPNNLEEAVEALANARRVAGDAIRCTFDGEACWAINVVTGGTSASMHDNLTDELKARWGPLAYLRVGVPAAINPPTFGLDLMLDDETEHRRVMNLVIANGRYAGGGFIAAPDADLQDGRLDIAALLPTDSLLETAELARKVVGGDHTADYTDDENTCQWRAKRVELKSDPVMPFTVDGETREAERATFEIAPGVLALLVAEPPLRRPALG